MIKVGLTGGIGSGKTFVAKHFENLGIPVYNSDDRGKILMNNSLKVREQLIKAFGADSYNEHGLNRAFLAKQVFNDSFKLNIINQIVHPAVQEDFSNWCQTHEHSPYIIKEAAILIESGAYKDCDKLIVVTAPFELRLKRIALRDNMTPEEINKRMSKQLSDEERLKHANFTLINDGIMLVEDQVKKIHAQLLKHKKDN